jgi:predicted RNA binding protein YcfA (HicA-like mRNA interferase family)
MMIKELVADGWTLDRQRGSHRQFRHPTKPGTVTGPGKMSDDLQRPLIASIVKQAGLERRPR